MPSSLFPNPSNSGNSILAAIQTMKGLSNGNPQALFDRMYQTDIQFRQFADSVKGKSPQQAFTDYGFDYNQVRGMF